jgi:hypothetical protein
MAPSLQQAPLIGYFLAIFSLLFATSPVLRLTKTTILFTLFALVSLVRLRLAWLVLSVLTPYSKNAQLLTWLYMLRYFAWSYYASAIRAGADVDDWTTSDWLGNTSLFTEAWLWVCTGAER